MADDPARLWIAGTTGRDACDKLQESSMLPGPADLARAFSAVDSADTEPRYRSRLLAGDNDSNLPDYACPVASTRASEDSAQRQQHLRALHFLALMLEVCRYDPLLACRSAEALQRVHRPAGSPTHKRCRTAIAEGSDPRPHARLLGHTDLSSTGSSHAPGLDGSRTDRSTMRSPLTTAQQMCPCCNEWRSEMGVWYGATVRVCSGCATYFTRLVKGGGTANSVRSAHERKLFTFMECTQVERRGRVSALPLVQKAAARMSHLPTALEWVTSLPNDPSAGPIIVSGYDQAVYALHTHVALLAVKPDGTPGRVILLHDPRSTVPYSAVPEGLYYVVHLLPLDGRRTLYASGCALLEDRGDEVGDDASIERLDNELLSTGRGLIAVGKPGSRAKLTPLKLQNPTPVPVSRIRSALPAGLSQLASVFQTGRQNKAGLPRYGAVFVKQGAMITLVGLHAKWHSLKHAKAVQHLEPHMSVLNVFGLPPNKGGGADEALNRRDIKLALRGRTRGQWHTPDRRPCGASGAGAGAGAGAGGGGAGGGGGGSGHGGGSGGGLG